MLKAKRYLATGVVIAAMLAAAGPARPQSYPGPDPRGGQYGGSGYGIPLGPAPAAAAPSAPAASAAPAAHRATAAAHHPAHRKRARSTSPLAGGTAAQLNREELARLGSAGTANPPPPTPIARQ